MSGEWGKRIARAAPKFTHTETTLVNYITENPHEAAFMSLKELCEATGISKPKVIDLYRKLDYENYKEFRHDVEQFYAHHINAYRASVTALRQIESLEDLVATAYDADVRSLQRLTDHISTEDLEYFARAIMESPSVYLHGSSTGMYPCHYLYQRLKRYRLAVHQTGQDVQHLLEDVYPIREGDLLIVFHYFPERERTHGIMKVARDGGARVMLVTDTILVEHAELVERAFFVERGSMGFRNSMAVPMHFVNLVILAIELIGGEEYKNRLRELETRREDYGLS